jgi:aspartate racemase
MRKLGLLGGISWVSTLDYYRYINEGVNERLGGLDYAECVVYSLNFNDIQRFGWDDWDRTFQTLAAAAMHLKAAGAEAIVLCANTAHALADSLEAHVGLPVLHIATATACEIGKRKLHKVALLGTKFTMELPFYRDKLAQHGIETIIPTDQGTRDFIQKTLKEELGRGITTDATRRAYLEIIDALVARGAEGVVFGCTELPLLLTQAEVAVPIFDTTRIHANAAVEWALTDAAAGSGRG